MNDFLLLDVNSTLINQKGQLIYTFKISVLNFLNSFGRNIFLLAHCCC